jgi:hypothetical protein
LAFAAALSGSSASNMKRRTGATATAAAAAAMAEANSMSSSADEKTQTTSMAMQQQLQLQQQQQASKRCGIVAALRLYALVQIVQVSVLGLRRVPVSSMGSNMGIGLLASLPVGITSGELLDTVLVHCVCLAFWNLLDAVLHHQRQQNQWHRAIVVPMLLLTGIVTHGQGMHIVANCIDVYRGHESESQLGALVYMLHEYVSHNLFYATQLFVVLFIVWHEKKQQQQQHARTPAISAAVTATSVAADSASYAWDLHGWLPVTALLHGLSFVLITIGVRTTPVSATVSLLVVLYASGNYRRLAQRPVLRYVATVCSVALVGYSYWFIRHQHAMPTFDDLRKPLSPMTFLNN